nr:hypothetical protein CFP56_57816 [Quercus suber]
MHTVDRTSQPFGPAPPCMQSDKVRLEKAVQSPQGPGVQDTTMVRASTCETTVIEAGMDKCCDANLVKLSSVSHPVSNQSELQQRPCMCRR